ncbi:MAG: bifunctional oligoribonuclease/PAP phosphatase NrnA [Crocinitomicaceae bacterium]|jgi:bifunctional oligoribonuclease and PAP phosphatase NrnA|nr:bifunctional oligoribonuclease/PAP phosphatase NrnA [Crocinitomicaceae bacterium]MDP4724226.1 bifunctional oligoribonuclease/PAP phosphatase NrnA [Crocinitomicaceae bacterium]MDP4805872.1 bifunctional oligoribonuclease/PAP phosphatase NrnA [Crocinitomicaceae bacterium]MDP4867440.1 bifunctional oligoribonuclease/PAP phosphatase NrnA [Crocinitomicaceae bacterium]MDP4955611.1 bifunctional oligoribonuclease/PAP phosphatase NrnA [Crocinitomicaceae bacterium]
MTPNHLFSTLESHHNWLITTHKGPDGDAVGSVVAWAAYAAQCGKNYLIVFPDQPAAYLCPFLEGYNWKVFAADQTYSGDLLFALDYNSSSRVGEVMSAWFDNQTLPKVMLDHHPNPADFVQIPISIPTACSTTEVIYHVLEDLGQLERINLAMAKGLYLGLMTDTGSFRFPSVSAYTHQMTAHLLSLGLAQHEIHEAVYDVNSVTRLQLRGYAIAEKLQLHPAQRLGIMSLSKEELKRFAYQKGDTEGLVNVILSIEGYDAGVFMMETEEGVKFSFRSKGQRFVNAFAQTHFNGGGHQYAAGGFYAGSLKDALAKLESLIDQI